MTRSAARRPSELQAQRPADPSEPASDVPGWKREQGTCVCAGYTRSKISRRQRPHWWDSRGLRGPRMEPSGSLLSKARNRGGGALYLMRPKKGDVQGALERGGSPKPERTPCEAVHRGMCAVRTVPRGWQYGQRTGDSEKHRGWVLASARL